MLAGDEVGRVGSDDASDAPVIASDIPVSMLAGELVLAATPKPVRS